MNRVCNIQLYWLDPKLDSKDNAELLSILKKQFPIEAFRTFVGCFYQLAKTSNTNIILIVPASLDQSQYSYFQDCHKISAITLYCKYQAQAQKLMSTYSKIRSAKYDPIQLFHFLKAQHKKQIQ